MTCPHCAIFLARVPISPHFDATSGRSSSNAPSPRRLGGLTNLYSLISPIQGALIARLPPPRTRIDPPILPRKPHRGKLGYNDRSDLRSKNLRTGNHDEANSFFPRVCSIPQSGFGRLDRLRRIGSSTAARADHLQLCVESRDHHGRRQFEPYRSLRQRHGCDLAGQSLRQQRRRRDREPRDDDNLYHHRHWFQRGNRQPDGYRHCCSRADDHQLRGDTSDHHGRRQFQPDGSFR